MEKTKSFTNFKNMLRSNGERLRGCVVVRHLYNMTVKMIRIKSNLVFISINEQVIVRLLSKNNLE